MADTARDEISRLEQEFEKDPEGRLFVHLADAYRKSGELERALDLLQQGLEQHGDSVSARLVLAQVHAEMGNGEDARSVWEAVIRQDADNETALRALGDLELGAGRNGEALRYYRRLVELGAGDDALQARITELDGKTGGGHRPEPKRAAPTARPTPAPAADAPRAAPPPDPEPAPAAQSGGDPGRGRAVAVDAGPGSRAEPSVVHTDAIGISDLLVRLLEYRDSTFRADSSLTRLLALAIGEELELERIHLDALALGALLSDLGGLALRDRVPQTPPGTEEAERAAEQREVAVSLQLLQGITLPAGVHEAVRHQHERWDGTGYPDGLREEEIPYTARVLAIGRACAERLTGSLDGQSRTVREALDQMQRQAGSRFDPVIVSVLRRVFQRRSEHGIGFGLGGRVLIVHPEELRSLGLATQLHTNGYVTEMTADTTRGRTGLRDRQADALVVGANLPATDLARFIREVRGNSAVAGIPIVAIDANEMNLRVELLTAGADVCFPSEISFREFKATLDALLRRREESAPLGA
ncbi:MAG: tetratricopeptide repeat protein [Gemmatimonadetes bacterium]|nr:tetratricopeptide repeat protein [Gemmatimonadota bacterium]